MAVLFVDGVRFGRECLVLAPRIDVTGHKHVLGVCPGSTENATVCQALLSNLMDRGLRREIRRDAAATMQSGATAPSDVG